MMALGHKNLGQHSIIFKQDAHGQEVFENLIEIGLALKIPIKGVENMALTLGNYR
jgi:hypothetical protein